MDQVAENLWLGNIASISDVEHLERNNIHSILSTMRGTVVIRGVSVAPKALTLKPSSPPADLRPQTNRNRRC